MLPKGKEEHGTVCVLTTWKPLEEGIKKTLTEAFTRNIWLVVKAMHRRKSKTDKKKKKPVTADITEVERNYQKKR